MRMSFLIIGLAIIGGCGKKGGEDTAPKIAQVSDEKPEPKKDVKPPEKDRKEHDEVKPDNADKKEKKYAPKTTEEPKEKIEPKIWDRDEFKTWANRTLRPGKTSGSTDAKDYFYGSAGPQAVLANLGKPDETSEDGPIMYWIYRNRTRDPITGKIDSTATIRFWRGNSGGSAQVVKDVSFK
jgi:hypothetical protein